MKRLIEIIKVIVYKTCEMINGYKGVLRNCCFFSDDVFSLFASEKSCMNHN